MELYVNPQITGFRQEVDGTIKELKIGTNKEDAYANIAEQGASAKLDNNKAATINVSTYTEPVVITPTSGKDGMKKATVTLSNIPTGIENFYAWKESVDNIIIYTTTATPTTSDSCYVPGETGHEITKEDIVSVGDGYITFEAEAPREFARYSTGDISLT